MKKTGWKDRHDWTETDRQTKMIIKEKKIKKEIRTKKNRNRERSRERRRKKRGYTKSEKNR